MVDQIEPSRRVSNTARESNRGRLVDVLRRQGPLPRVALARSTGLSFPAVSGLTSRLIAEELLCETETAATPWSEDGEEEDADGLNGPRRGRPAVLLTLNPEFGRIAAVSVRMNLIETLIADFRGSGVAQSRLALSTRALDAGALRDPRDCADQCAARCDGDAAPSAVRNRDCAARHRERRHRHDTVESRTVDHRSRSGDADTSGVRRRCRHGERRCRGRARPHGRRTGIGARPLGHDHGRSRHRDGRRCRW
ncbi:hypothetical protein ACVWXM_000942 [Bradyrhizobium sp. GM7.3]